MYIPDIKDEVAKGKKVHFSHYTNEELWYVTDGGFEFPVSISDTGRGIFLREDKAITFMRWIRKRIQVLKEVEE